MKLTRPLLVALVIVALISAACSLGVVSQFGSHIPPRDLTETVMFVMKRRILQYAVENGSLPTTPEQLPQMVGYHNGTTDGWGRQITWRVDGDNVTLMSYGRDGKPGGDGDDADIVRTFRAKMDNGKWAGELGEWQRDLEQTGR